VCVSTQVGCPIGCIFCASGLEGLVRDLGVAEIVEQVLHVRRRLGRRPSHVVVMGMGEGLLNLDALAAAVRLWRHPDGLAISPRRITVSTASRGALIDRLADADLGVNLAVSLHGADDATRSRLVPTSGPGRVDELVQAAARYAARTGRDATVEYVLIAGVNDDLAQADALARRVRGRHLHVNLIPLNPVAHRPDLEAPGAPVARAFLERLKAAGASATLRTRRGDDIDAACGQLAVTRSRARAREDGGATGGRRLP
jgi:23S rRNA (adenine2503-C2)-methyltransferase